MTAASRPTPSLQIHTAAYALEDTVSSQAGWVSSCFAAASLQILQPGTPGANTAWEQLLNANFHTLHIQSASTYNHVLTHTAEATLSNSSYPSSPPAATSPAAVLSSTTILR